MWCGGGRGMEKRRATSEPSLRVGKRMHDNRNARFSSMDSVPSRSRLLDAGGSLHGVLACSHPEFTPGSINLPISTHSFPPSCPTSFFSLFSSSFRKNEQRAPPRQRGLSPHPIPPFGCPIANRPPSRTWLGIFSNISPISASRNENAVPMLLAWKQGARRRAGPSDAWGCGSPSGAGPACQGRSARGSLLI